MLAYLTEHLSQIIPALAFVPLVFMWVWIAKKIDDARTGFDDDEQIEQHSNLAVGFRRAGLYAGTVIGMLGPLYGQSIGLLQDLWMLFYEGALVTVFMLIAGRINDTLLVHGINNDTHVESGNNAVGIAECGSYIATGLILYGSFAGEGGGVISAIVFFALGQMVLIAFAYLYERATPYHIVELIRQGQASAGLMLAGVLVALGFILQSSLIGPFTGWTNDIVDFLLFAVVGIVLLTVLQKLIDWFFLPNTDFKQEIERDNNIAAVALATAILITLSLVISNAVI